MVTLFVITESKKTQRLSEDMKEINKVSVLYKKGVFHLLLNALLA